jgi:serine/threonine protein kinase
MSNFEEPHHAAPGPGAAPSPPRDLDYELVRLIGLGAYGEVWLVRDKAGLYRACKVVYRQSFTHERPYEREYQGIQKFEPISRDNDSQVRILHVGRRDEAGYFYYIMELADDIDSGPKIRPDEYVPKTLKREVLRRGRLPVRECIELGISLSEALENLHSHGLIHRDIKPANIIFVNGVPRLADIGLVTDADVSVSYVGTGGFIPPEGPTSPQADIYGLGKVLYEISTGKDRLEFPELPPDFASWPDREALLELNAVMVKACEPKVQSRYKSAAELHADLSLLSRGKSVLRAHSLIRRRRLALKVGAAMTVLAAAAALTMFYLDSRHEVRDKLDLSFNSTERLPLPETRRVVESEAKLRVTYSAELESGNARTRVSAANDLLKQSATAQDPAFELASLRMAALLAGHAGDYFLLMDVCDRMEARFQMRALPVKLEMLTETSRSAASAKSKSDLAEVCVAGGFEAVAADDYPAAGKFAGLSRAAAQESGDSHCIKQSEFLGGEIVRCRNGYERAETFFQILRDKPGDPRASFEVGRFFCFVKNDWDRGLPLMAHGDDASLKGVLEREILKQPTDPVGQVALGQMWWDLSNTAVGDDKLPFQKRARYWFLKAISNAKEPERSRLQQELHDRLKAVASQTAEVHLTARIYRAEIIDIYADEIRWKSGRGSNGDQVNHVRIGQLQGGDLKVIKNAGATRLYPEDVDFTNATLTIDHKPKRRGRAELQILPDHVRVLLADPPFGSAEIEVTVMFGNPPQ